MRAEINLELNTGTAEEAQRIVEKACSELKATGLIKNYRYEIETPDGAVTEKCVLSEGKVIA
jgi:phosphoribosylformylglycinamidine (FGAM) synthase PurS component